MIRLRALLLVALALAAGACSAPAPPEAASTPAPTPTPAPVAVYVQVAEEAGPAVGAWAQALRSAVEGGQGGLALAAAPEEAAVTVRIDEVEAGVEASQEPPGEGELNRMRGALVVDGSAREFSLVYRGEPGPQAEVLARNLRRFATEGGAEEPGASPEGDNPADEAGAQD